MINKIEKTYLILLVVLLIICIIITMFVCQKSNEDYKPDKEIKIHIVHTLEDTKSLQDNIDKVYRTIDNNIAYSLEYNGTSPDITPKDWVKIGDYINSVYDNYDSFIVISSDNTITYTSAALTYMLESLTKPIIMTSTMDTDDDIVNGLTYACELKIPEVVIMSDNKIYRGCCSTRTNTGSFTSIDVEPLAVLIKENIEVNNDIVLETPISEMVYKPFNTNINVIVIKLFPGITGDYINKTLDDYHVQGIVFELIGDGDSPVADSFLSAIDNLYKKRTLMVGVPQMTHRDKKVKNNEKINVLEKRGILNGNGMTIESSVAKLYHIISTVDDFKEAIRLISVPLRGEISK